MRKVICRGQEGAWWGRRWGVQRCLTILICFTRSVCPNQDNGLGWGVRIVTMMVLLLLLLLLWLTLSAFALIHTIIIVLYTTKGSVVHVVESALNMSLSCCRCPYHRWPCLWVCHVNLPVWSNCWNGCCWGQCVCLVIITYVTLSCRIKCILIYVLLAYCYHSLSWYWLILHNYRCLVCVFLITQFLYGCRLHLLWWQ